MQILEKLYRRENLACSEMKEIAREMLGGKLTEAQMSALLISLKVKGETKEEMTGISEVLRELAVEIPYADGEAMCNCGTGGDQSNSFNISTTSAFVLAAGGVKMAKTGNRSVSSKSGSFDLCEALGIDFMKTPASLAKLLHEVGIAFIFAPMVHPNMKYIGKVRQDLATPTIMNLIGPIANPVPLDYQLMGTFRRELVKATAETLGSVGRKRAIVINGAHEMDEASLTGKNYFALYQNGQITSHTFTPEDVGMPCYQLADIRGGDAIENASIFHKILAGEASAYYDTVLLNAGLGFYACGKTDTIRQGIELSDFLLQSGQVKAKFKELIKKQEEVA